MINAKTLISTLAITSLLGLGAAAVAKPYGHAHSHSETIKQINPAASYSAPPSYLKPGASVSYSHNLKPSLALGETQTFQLILDEAYNSGWLDVKIAGEGAISLYTPADQLQMDMSDGHSHVIDITVTANANGRHYINVHAVTDKGEPRIFGIGVQVGPPIAQKPSANMTVMPNGEKLILMDAVEVVK